MKIAVIGAGAMGSIYGAHLSTHNDVYLIDKNPQAVKAINEKGIVLHEYNSVNTYNPKAFLSSKELGKMDLVILFVKALYSKAALQENLGIIGDNTYLMTLQNGSGHEDILSEVVPLNRIIIGTTEDNGNVVDSGVVKHGGTGKTNIGMLVKDEQGMLLKLKNVFDNSGFKTVIHENIQQLIWDKLMTNISLSAVTGILQVQMGFIARNEYAWAMTEQLVREALNVAKAMKLTFDEKSVLEKIKNTSINNPEGKTSIYTDLKNGRKTEVDTISGSVVRAAKKYNVFVPTHEFVVNMVHAIESKNNK